MIKFISFYYKAAGFSYAGVGVAAADGAVSAGGRGGGQRAGGVARLHGHTAARAVGAGD
ncbi:hypothetical protein MKX70_15925 [Paenibacillus sp. FSL R7-0312]|uniref:hypothetical protein n=1 Tax=Paenibacillus sp. FSL R7-0312 TaxID=2921682 RepID=UPI0030FBD7D4